MNIGDFFNLTNLPYEILGEAVSALISLVLLINIVTSFSWSLRKERLFFIGTLGCFLSCIFDVFSVFSIANTHIFPNIINTLISTVYFVSLVVVPVSMALYAYEISYAYREKHDLPIFWIIIGIFGIYVLVMLINIKTGWVFRFDEEIGYTHGPLQYITYGMALTCLIIIEILVIPHKKSMASKLFNTMIFYPVVAILILVVQFVNPQILCTGTASIAGILFAYMSIQNEMAQYDNETGLMTEKKLEKHVELEKTTGILYVISIENMVSIQNNLSVTEMNKLFLRIGTEFIKRFERHCYHISTNRYAAIGESREQVEKFAEEIKGVIESINENKALLPIPMEVYSVAVELTKEGSKTFANVMEIINNLFIKAKGQGNKDLIFSDESVLLDMERKRIIYNILKRELNADSTQYQVWYQPIYSIKEQKFVYMEALSRLIGTELGDIPPGEFVSVAENKGLIDQLTKVAFEKICKFISEHNDAVTAVSINFSPIQMTNPEIVKTILSTIGAYNLEPSRIILEITETMLINNFEIVSKNMNELAAAGVKFYLDDFGTGYSNLYNLVALPFAAIKMDRLLVLSMEQSIRNFQMFKSLVDTFKKSDFEVVVEGVETKKQHDFVVKAGADYIQGFLFSRPIPPEESLKIISLGVDF